MSALQDSCSLDTDQSPVDQVTAVTRATTDSGGWGGSSVRKFRTETEPWRRHGPSLSSRERLQSALRSWHVPPEVGDRRFGIPYQEKTNKQQTNFTAPIPVKTSDRINQTFM